MKRKYMVILDHATDFIEELSKNKKTIVTKTSTSMTLITYKPDDTFVSDRRVIVFAGTHFKVKEENGKSGFVDLSTHENMIMLDGTIEGQRKYEQIAYQVERLNAEIFYKHFQVVD